MKILVLTYNMEAKILLGTSNMMTKIVRYVISIQNGSPSALKELYLLIIDDEITDVNSTDIYATEIVNINITDVNIADDIELDPDDQN